MTDHSKRNAESHGTLRARLTRHVAHKERGKSAKSVFNTIPIVLVGSMAMGLGFTGPVDLNPPKRTDKPKASPSELGKVIREALATASSRLSVQATAPGIMAVAATVPASYRVAAGDTVSSIAGRFGLATASVLALNGLGWKSIIFPGQVLKLTKGGSVSLSPAPAPLGNSRYTIVAGDTIGGIAAKHHVSTQSVLTANGLSPTSIIYPGQTIAIPGLSTASSSTTPISTPQRSTADAGTISTTPNNYVVKSGDTVSSIATKFGVSIQAILNANGLNWTSIIYIGRSLTIPGQLAFARAGTATPVLTTEMAQNARTIVRTGKSLRVSDYGLVIALAAAMQESSLRNLDYGDLDSLGLFQQRPSAGWGTPAKITDPVYASKLFFGGPSNPNRGITRGLLDIPGWQTMTVTQAAQAVQNSAYPNAYAQWETAAWVWLDQLT